MRITFQPVRQTQSGFALLIVMCFLAASLIVFASVMYWVSTNANITQRNNSFNQSEAAAESATEYVISQMISDFNNLCLNPSNYYEPLTPPTTPSTGNWPVQYQFSATNGASGLSVFVSIGPTNWGAVPSQFTGLNGYGQNCIIACTATPVGQAVNVPATVCQNVWFGTIPMCQYAVFYNVVLEINPGAAFTISGRVHCNTNIYCTGSSAGSPLTFSSSVDAAGTITNNPNPCDPQNYGNRTGNVVYNGGTPIQNYDTLNLPLGNCSTNYTFSQIESLLQLPPAAYASGTQPAYNTNGLVYFANKADLIISNDVATGANFTVLYQNPNNSPNYLTAVLPDATNRVPTIYTTNQTTHLPTTNVYALGYTNIYFSYVTNVTFYDYREGDTVKAIQIDVGKLGAWLGNTNSRGGWNYELKNASGTSIDVGHVVNSIFVFNSVNPTTGTLPAVRLVNGTQLPTNTVRNANNGQQVRASGLGIATAQPIYVEGNYNVTTDLVHYAYTLGSTTNGCTLPAALIGDAITILSSNFVDYPTSATAPLDPTTAETAITINAACFEGIVPSNCSYYSGGLENFLRLLENWGSKTVNYNGSIVVMFPSTYATSHWGGSYYTAPNRAWGFDTTFMQPIGQPPLFPSLKADARYSWTYR
jgi:hypothetical protein